MAGTDKDGKKFSASVGDLVSLDQISETNLIAKGMAEPARKAKK